MSACESYRNIVAFPTVCMKVPLFLAIIPELLSRAKGEKAYSISNIQANTGFI